MKTVLKLVAVCGLVCAAGVSLAVSSETLTKDEKFLAVATRLEMFERLHNANTRKASIAGQKAVVPNLTLQVTDEKGVALPDASLPPALANLEADLRNTDILGELRNGGLRIDPEASQAPHLTLFVVGMPATSKPEFRTRKLYLVGGVVGQTMTLGFGKRETLATGTYFSAPIIATDEEGDAQTIRVAVRKIVDQYIREVSGK
jgi:hypothetical protein